MAQKEKEFSNWLLFLFTFCIIIILVVGVCKPSVHHVFEAFEALAVKYTRQMYCPYLPIQMHQRIYYTDWMKSKIELITALPTGHMNWVCDSGWTLDNACSIQYSVGWPDCKL